MKDRARFASTMTAMALVLPGRPLTDPTLEVYWRVLADLTDAELERAATAILRDTSRPVFFPTPAELLLAARPRDPAAAMRTLDRLRLLAEYSPRVGDTWSVSRIRAELGEAAVTAYLVAGASSGMRELADPAHAPFVRNRFVAAYDEAVARNPLAALPAGPDHTPARVHALTRGIGDAA
jgi:hypothetical protein